MGNLDRRDFMKAAAAMGLTAALREFGWSMATAAEEAGPMPMRALGRTGLKVGILGLGGSHATMHEKEEDSLAIMHRAIDLGVNFFDNADCYAMGVAEERMGKALVGRRDKVVLMTKVDDWDAKGAMETLDISLKSLRTDYLDVWQFHGVFTIADLDKILAPGGGIEAAEKAKKAGKIRAVGLTGHLGALTQQEAIRRYPFDTIQPALNCVDPHFENFRHVTIDEAVKHNTGVIAMKTMAFGQIYKQKVASVEEALRWVWSQPISTAVSGCEKMEFLNHNAYLAKTFTPMSEQEQAALLARTEPFKGAKVEVYKTWTTNENKRRPRT
jgi:predicted aldo/keto reductase-like oxidoreductase